jgi:oligopeptide/dipeptide ABC transporter ATP-binding protein
MLTGLINMLVAFPGLILALFFAVVFGVGATGAVLALGIAGAPALARLTHTLASSVGGSDYVAAARVLGVSRVRLLTRHVLPNIAEPLLLNVTTSIGAALLAFSALSFLGLGVQPPFYDWGRMLNEGLSRIYVNPAGALAPGLAIIMAGLTFNLLGEGLAQVASGRSTARWSRPPHQRPTELTTERPTGAPGDDEDLVLDVRGLSVTFPSATGDVHAVRDVTITVRRGEIVGIVGESGSGKTVTALAIAQLVSFPGRVAVERFRFDGRDVLDLPVGERRRLLATSLPMVYQNPGTALNPALRVGGQLAEVVEVHRGMSRSAATQRAADKLRQVAIAAPERRLRAYPHELSGGMKQRAVIAMGLMGEPILFLADEPTTALDVTVQRQIFDLLRQVNRDEGASVVLISHDVAAVAELCTRVVVMYAGRIVEEGATNMLLHGAAHPYTRALIGAVPDMTADRDRPLPTISGRPPDPREVGAGCPFAPRCPHADTRCAAERPTLDPLADGWLAACWHPQRLVDRT